MSKAVAKKKDTAVGQVQDYGDFSGAGLDHVTAEERVVPFINVLQALSPEVEELDDAKSGMLFNKGTQELYVSDEGFLFLPVLRQSAYVEWTPRTKGGGLVGRHDRNSEVVIEAKKAAADRGEDPRFTLLWTGEPDESNELRETYYLYGLLLEESGDSYEIVGPALLSFGSTKIKVYKNWLNSVLSLKGKPPIFAHPLRVTTTKQKNTKGEFYNYKLSPAKGSIAASQLQMEGDDLELMKTAHKFAAQVSEGEFKMGEEGEADATDEDIPF